MTQKELEQLIISILNALIKKGVITQEDIDKELYEMTKGLKTRHS